ncbi:flagellar basal-body MS-ring/collar protein FliF [Collimonas sp. OK412]|uniref:flagellar basal-body MS-ring/collar protein FliF n=1 Tax=Collimonas sp. (strain OK412) TaxID=1801619 RepID=UPI0008E4C463|nr:flagellar basal-body MS-ring/collar protein FliF [Collimonas sp. OK412]SFC97659.1 flagellar M-ring protein FliF [Collimonas sp. OK412]
MIDAFWKNLGRSARIGLVTGVLLIVAFLAFGIWSLRTEYQVLFSDLAPQDAAAMVAELDRMKVPYKLGDNGASILVDKESVHQTRLKLMSKELPLHGTIGFELFNNTDFGMTEFAQKINYQRALQGEITRTILSLSEIQAARVHLALPEEGLFKRSNNVATAAITLTMKEGKILRPEQVSGIQRLVSSAVPGIAIADVTIVDQHGVALTHMGRGEGNVDATSSRLELKKETENYLSHKANEVLERTFGVGQALASVDVVLNMDQVRTTTEDVVSPPGRNGQTPTGVVVREREVMRDGGAPLDNKFSTGASGGSQREVEYSVGRRVEQVVAVPGSIRRIQVVAVVPKSLDEAQVERIRNVVAAAVGASRDRGDTVVVQPLNAFGAGDVAGGNRVAAGDGNVHEDADRSAAPASNGIASSVSDRTSQLVPLLLLALLLVAVSIFGVASLRGHRKTATDAPALSEEQREVVLQQIRSWMQEPSAVSGASSKAKT